MTAGSQVDPHPAMTPQKIASGFRAMEKDRIDVEGDGCCTALDVVESYLDGYENGVFDFLAAARVAVVRPTRDQLAETIERERGQDLRRWTPAGVVDILVEAGYLDVTK